MARRPALCSWSRDVASALSLASVRCTSWRNRWRSTGGMRSWAKTSAAVRPERTGLPGAPGARASTEPPRAAPARPGLRPPQHRADRAWVAPDVPRWGPQYLQSTAVKGDGWCVRVRVCLAPQADGYTYKSLLRIPPRTSLKSPRSFLRVPGERSEEC